MHQSLLELVDQGVIDAVVCPLKSGKEADLFVVERGPYHYVAKVYRERRLRSFKNDAGYREGRKVRGSRDQRALDRKTKYGQRLAEDTWHKAEAEALSRLEAAGARVPRVLYHHERVLVMEMICTADGQLAPQLAQIRPTRERAIELFDSILTQVVLMLQSHLVHADLSPYNILIREDGPVVIDLPQCVSAAHNQQADKMLERDIRSVIKYLGIFAPEVREAARDAWQFWAEYERGALTVDFRPEKGRPRPKAQDEAALLEELLPAMADEGEEEQQPEASLAERAAAGDEAAKALLRAAERREAKRARRAEEAAAARLQEAPQTRQPAGDEDGEPRGRRRRRRGRGAGDEQASGGQRPGGPARGQRRDDRGPAPGRDDRGQHGQGPRRDDRGQGHGQGPRRDDRGQGHGQGPRRDDRGQHGQGPRRDDRGQGHGQGPRRDDRGQGHGQGPRRDDRGQQGQGPRRDDRGQQGQGPRRDDRGQQGQGPRRDDRGQQGQGPRRDDRGQQGQGQAGQGQGGGGRRRRRRGGGGGGQAGQGAPPSARQP